MDLYFQISFKKLTEMFIFSMTRPSYKLKDHLEGKVVLIDWCTFKLSKLLQVKTNFADDVLPPMEEFEKTRGLLF